MSKGVVWETNLRRNSIGLDTWQPTLLVICWIWFQSYLYNFSSSFHIILWSLKKVEQSSYIYYNNYIVRQSTILPFLLRHILQYFLFNALSSTTRITYHLFPIHTNTDTFLLFLLPAQTDLVIRPTSHSLKTTQFRSTSDHNHFRSTGTPLHSLTRNETLRPPNHDHQPPP